MLVSFRTIKGNDFKKQKVNFRFSKTVHAKIDMIHILQVDHNQTLHKIVIWVVILLRCIYICVCLSFTVVGQLPEINVIQNWPNQEPIIDHTLGNIVDNDFDKLRLSS